MSNKVSKREELIQVARRLFALGGFHATSVSEIAEQAGIQKSTLFHHFSSKENLCEQVAESVGHDLATDKAAFLADAVSCRLLMQLFLKGTADSGEELSPEEELLLRQIGTLLADHVVAQEQKRMAAAA